MILMLLVYCFLIVSGVVVSTRDIIVSLDFYLDGNTPLSSLFSQLFFVQGNRVVISSPEIILFILWFFFEVEFRRETFKVDTFHMPVIILQN